MREKSVYVFGSQIELPMLIHVSRVCSHVASRVTWHSHGGFELLFLLEGATAYEFAGQQGVELHGGHFLVIPPGLVHRGLHDVRSPSTICGLALKASRPSAWNHTTLTSADVGRLRTALENASQKVHPFNPALRWLVRRLLEETSNYPANPRRAEAGIALRHVGFSRARMFDIFKTQTGLTPNDYLQRARVEKAQEQLRQTNLSVTQIALATGFSSGQYFSTVFARYTGVSPTAFRKGAKPRGPLRVRPQV